MEKLSVWRIVRAFKWRVSFTLSLVVLEALLLIAYPAVIGLAVDQLLEQQYQGLYWLGALGLSSLVLGSFRRFYDTRVYAGLYANYAQTLSTKDAEADKDVSVSNARVELLKEFFDFLEESLPETVNIVIGVVGVGLLISQLNLSVFWACCGLLLLIFVVFIFSADRNYRLNKGFNSQFEKQVEVLKKGRSRGRFLHFHRLMEWRIKLSDLETLNYFVIWLGVIALMLFTPLAAVSGGETTAGGLLSLIMYVFEFIDSVILIPLLVQQLIRLQEISHRLSRA